MSRLLWYDVWVGNFRRYMWPILGQTTLDLLWIIDWAVSTLNVESHISIGGLSMGGDIAIAATGRDHRFMDPKPWWPDCLAWLTRA